jgi:hypothetical protein
MSLSPESISVAKSRNKRNKCLHRFGMNVEKYSHFVHREVDERIIFKRSLKKWGGRELNSAGSE